MASFLPSVEDGYLPYYLLLVSVAAVGNAVQNFMTLAYTRRIYNGLFVPRSPTAPRGSPNSVEKLQPVVDAPSAQGGKPTAVDQVTPLAARLFAVYTLLAGVIRVYGAYRVHDPVLYQLCLLTHLVAAAHFTSEALVFKTVSPNWEHAFPFAAAFSGSWWMIAQYGNYVH